MTISAQVEAVLDSENDISKRVSRERKGVSVGWVVMSRDRRDRDKVAACYSGETLLKRFFGTD